MIGHTLDNRYLILRQVGQGGMGAVYEARHQGTNRRVAVKVILREMMAGEQLARFQREARIVGAVESQHITQVFDTGVDPSSRCPYIAMEFLDGEDVGALIRRLGPLPIDLAVRIASQACAGLGRAHDAGVVHRDIKSGNLFLHRNEPGHRIVKLLDFGIAKAGGELGDGGVTKTGALVGSPLYMSPEQARGMPVDPRSDIFSLGITLYEMLGGRRPNDDITQLGELIFRICSQPARWLQDMAPWVPAELAGIVHKALAIEPSARYQSAAEMAAALKALLPAGHYLEEPMLLPIDPTLRGRAAPRGSPLEHTGDPRAITATTNRHAASVAGVSTGVVAPPAPPKKTGLGLVIGGVFGALLLGAGAGIFLLKNASGSGGDAAAQPASTTASEATSAAPTVAASATDAPTAQPASSASAEPAAPTTSTTAADPQATKTSVTAKPKAPAPTTKPVTKPNKDDETSRK